MKIYKTLKTVLTLFGLGLLSLSCTDDNTKVGTLSLDAKATLTNLKSANSFSKNASTIIITDFLVNIKEFELELDDDQHDDNDEQWDDDGYFDHQDEIELEGPFELDLINGQVTFLSVDLPNGNYEEIEFKFNKSKDQQSEMFDKSIQIKGTIDGTPFIFWHDFTDEIELDFDDPQFDINVQNNVNELVIDFDLTSLFTGISAIDMSQAADGNENGIIEINPNDTDGNKDLSHQLKNKIKTLINLLDD